MWKKSIHVHPPRWKLMSDGHRILCHGRGQSRRRSMLRELNIPTNVQSQCKNLSARCCCWRKKGGCWGGRKYKSGWYLPRIHCTRHLPHRRTENQTTSSDRWTTNQPTKPLLSLSASAQTFLPNNNKSLPTTNYLPFHDHYHTTVSSFHISQLHTRIIPLSPTAPQARHVRKSNQGASGLCHAETLLEYLLEGCVFNCPRSFHFALTLKGESPLFFFNRANQSSNSANFISLIPFLRHVECTAFIHTYENMHTNFGSEKELELQDF